MEGEKRVRVKGEWVEEQRERGYRTEVGGEENENNWIKQCTVSRREGGKRGLKGSEGRKKGGEKLLEGRGERRGGNEYERRHRR